MLTPRCKWKGGGVGCDKFEILDYMNQSRACDHTGGLEHVENRSGFRAPAFPVTLQLSSLALHGRTPACSTIRCSMHPPIQHHRLSASRTLMHCRGAHPPSGHWEQHAMASRLEQPHWLPRQRHQHQYDSPQSACMALTSTCMLHVGRKAAAVPAHSFIQQVNQRMKLRALIAQPAQPLIQQGAGLLPAHQGPQLHQPPARHTRQQHRGHQLPLRE